MMITGFMVSHYALSGDSNTVFKAGHISLQIWDLGEVPYPDGNAPNRERVELGKMLFFDPRLSLYGNMSCATCHNPLFGWSDGLPKGRGFKDQELGRASPSIINVAHNSIQMWDGRAPTLEAQAIGPMRSRVEMNMDVGKILTWLNSVPAYIRKFEAAYPGEKIDEDSLSKAIASFERTVISNDSPFDRWVKGDRKAMTKKQINGFKVFSDPKKGNCVVCHSAPNFTDDGFHNIGLASYGDEKPDMGRYAEKPVRLMKGAFKTPTLRDVTLTAPYFHDGSAANLQAVIDHYIKGGDVKTNLSPELKKLSLSKADQSDLLNYLEALTSPVKPFVLPVLPN